MKPQIPERKNHATQPLNVIDIDDALLKLSTLSAISGRARATMDRDVRAGLLSVTKIGQRCTRVKSQEARAYLQRLAKAAA